jgi:REP element-mobilizing transposase RayT
MPDRARGYVRRDEGILAADEDMARFYEEQAKNAPTISDSALQRILIEELIVACQHQQVRLHAVKTEPSHIHGLVSWRAEKGWLAVRTGLKSSLSQRPRKQSSDGDPLRLSEGASRKHVRDHDHLDHLMKICLPKHCGLAWYEDERQWVNQSS